MAKEFTGQKILAVDDVPINLKMTTVLLENMGLYVDSALNGAEAVEVFAQSEVGEYAAILMDVMMPEMDGLEATKVIRKMERKDAASIPILALTANDFEEDRAKFLAVGMNGYILKPLDCESACRELRKCMFPEEE